VENGLHIMFEFWQVTNPKWERTREGEDHFGWVFPASEDEEPGAQPDVLNGRRSIRELYELSVPGYSGKCSVPVSLSVIHFQKFQWS
jgi:glutathionyl-hydroquinone reductase